MTRPPLSSHLRPRRTPARLVAALLLIAACVGEGRAARAETSGRVAEVEVAAPSLAGNLVGTETAQKTLVYLPPSYEAEPARRYPTLYLLHGIFDSRETWVQFHGLPAILDRLIGAGDLPELIVVMPDGGNRYGGGFYRNSPVTGRWADFVADDLVGFVDGRFRTRPEREARAVAGHSMGGYGSIHLGMTRPEVFAVVWAMSPCCLAAEQDLSFGNEAWKRASRVEGPEQLGDLFARQDFYAVAALGVLAAFQPDTSQPPFHVDFPFDVVQGEIVLDDPAYDRYLDSLPVRQVRPSREALRSLSGFALDVGLGDQFLHIPEGVFELAERLGEERIPFLLDVYDGDHRQQVGRRLEEVVLPWIGERLTRE